MNSSVNIEKQLHVAHRRLIDEYLRPEGLLSDYVGEIPTPLDCEECRPNAMGWWSPIENGPMFTGPYLRACVDRAKQLRGTAEFENAKSECAKMAAGLIKAASVSNVPGIIVRGFGTDGKCHYPLGSTDQTLPWFFGLHAYVMSDFPSEEEKTAIVTKMRDVADALEKNGWGCPCDGHFKGQDRGNFLKEGKLFFRAATHYLFVLASMYEVTGDKHWRDMYLEALDSKIEGCEFTRLEVCESGWKLDAETFPAEGGLMWIYVCAQGCLAELVRMESCRSHIAERMRKGLIYNALRAHGQMQKSEHYDNCKETPFKYANWRTGYRWRKQQTQKDAGEVASSGIGEILGTRKKYEREYMTLPLSAAAVCGYAGLYRDEIEKAISHYDFNEINICEFYLAEVAAFSANETSVRESRRMR